MRAILKYDLANATWEAEVECVGDEGFKLRISHHGVSISGAPAKFQDAGVFKTGGAVVKYVRDLAAKKFPGWNPTVDTLDTIKHRTAESVAPQCYSPVPQGSVAGGRGRSECPACPYRSGCGDPASVMAAAPEGEAEDEDDFLKRLQRKVSKTYKEKS